jgi:hypothetical protein
VNLAGLQLAPNGGRLTVWKKCGAGLAVDNNFFSYIYLQPTIRLERNAGYLPCPFPALRSEYIVGCIFNSVGLIIARESPCIYSYQLILL